MDELNQNNDSNDTNEQVNSQNEAQDSAANMENAQEMQALPSEMQQLTGNGPEPEKQPKGKTPFIIGGIAAAAIVIGSILIFTLSAFGQNPEKVFSKSIDVMSGYAQEKLDSSILAQMEQMTFSDQSAEKFSIVLNNVEVDGAQVLPVFLQKAGLDLTAYSSLDDQFSILELDLNMMGSKLISLGIELNEYALAVSVPELLDDTVLVLDMQNMAENWNNSYIRQAFAMPGMTAADEELIINALNDYYDTVNLATTQKESMELLNEKMSGLQDKFFENAVVAEDFLAKETVEGIECNVLEVVLDKDVVEYSIKELIFAVLDEPSMSSFWSSYDNMLSMSTYGEITLADIREVYNSFTIDKDIVLNMAVDKSNIVRRLEFPIKMTFMDVPFDTNFDIYYLGKTNPYEEIDMDITVSVYGESVSMNISQNGVYTDKNYYENAMKLAMKIDDVRLGFDYKVSWDKKESDYSLYLAGNLDSLYDEMAFAFDAKGSMEIQPENNLFVFDLSNTKVTVDNGYEKVMVNAGIKYSSEDAAGGDYMAGLMGQRLNILEAGENDLMALFMTVQSKLQGFEDLLMNIF